MHPSVQGASPDESVAEALASPPILGVVAARPAAMGFADEALARARQWVGCAAAWLALLPMARTLVVATCDSSAAPAARGTDCRGGGGIACGIKVSELMISTSEQLTMRAWHAALRCHDAVSSVPHSAEPPTSFRS